MALKLVIHPSATGTALEHDRARGVIQCNGEKFCCVCVNLYVPEFNNMTHSFSLPAVSVYTAELVAILMALQHMSAIHTPPSAIVICSDSKAALSSIGSDSANAREDLVSEIVTTTHQVITRGTEVRFQCVPAHVSLSGNEKADRAAKTRQSTSTSAWPIFIPG